MRKIAVFSFVFFFLLFSYLWADEVFLKDGGRLQGLVVAEDELAIIMETPQGKATVNKSDIVHVEYWDAKENKQFQKSMIDKIKEYVKKSPKDHWRGIKNYFRRIHFDIFGRLEKNTIYQKIAYAGPVKRLRKLSPAYYVFAVYFGLLFILAVIGTVIKNFIMAVVRKFCGVKRRYDA